MFGIRQIFVSYMNPSTEESLFTVLICESTTFALSLCFLNQRSNVNQAGYRLNPTIRLEAMLIKYIIINTEWLFGVRQRDTCSTWKF